MIANHSIARCDIARRHRATATSPHRSSAREDRLAVEAIAASSSPRRARAILALPPSWLRRPPEHSTQDAIASATDPQKTNVERQLTPSVAGLRRKVDQSLQ